MKTKVKRMSKRTLAVFLGVLMLVTSIGFGSLVTANAWAINGGKVYFIKPSTWTSGVQLLYSLNDGSSTKTKTFTQLSGSLYYCDYGSSSFESKDLAYIDASGWGDENNTSVEARKKYASHRSWTKNSAWDWYNSGNFYLITMNSGDADSDFSQTDNTDRDTLMKKTQQANVYTNKASSSTGGSVSLTGYYFTADNAVASSSSSSSYDAVVGTTMTMTATAKKGYEFDGWYSDSSCSTKLSSNVTYSYTVSAAKTVYANFKTKVTTYTGITAVAKGTTDGSNYSVSLATLQSSTSVTSTTGLAVNATTQSGYTFYKWVASGSGTFANANSASTTFYPSANSEVATAQYKKNYTFSNGTTDTHGTVTVPDGTKLAGSSYSGTVTPADGYKIKTLTVGGVSVSGAVGKTAAYTYSGTTGTSNTGTSTPISVVATFEANASMNLYIAGRFRVRPSSGSTSWTTTYASGSDWNATSTNIPFVYDSGTTYKVQTYASLAELSAQIGSSSYTGDPVFFVYDTTNSKNWYASSATTMNTTGTTLASSGGSNSNLKFSSSSTDSPVTIYYDTNTHKIWYTIPEFHDVTVSTATGGSVTASPSRAEGGSTVTLTISPSTGYQLSSITAYKTGAAGTTVTLSGTGNTRTFTMPAYDVTVTPSFSKITWSGLSAVGKYSTTGASGSYTNTWSSGGPNVTIASTSATQLDGVAVTAPGTDPTGYVFAGWITNNGSFTNAANKDTTFKPNAANAQAVATYKKIYTITASVDGTGKGAGTVTTSKSTVEAGGSYTITTAANTNSSITSVTVNDTNKGTGTSITISSVTANQTVVAKFASKPHLIGSLAASGWTTPGDEMTSNSDGTKFTITLSEKAARTYEFKHYNNGTYDATQITSANQTLNGIATIDNTGTNGNYKLVTSVKSNIVLESDGTKFTKITVTPANVPTYNVTLKKVAGSTITSTYMGVEYTTASADAVVPVYSGTEISFTVTAASGKYLSGLTTSAGSLSPVFAAGDSYTGKISNVTSARTVTPTVGNKVTITAKSNKSSLGTVSISPTSARPGENVTITIEEKNGTYKSGSLSVKKADGTAISTTTPSRSIYTSTFTMPNDTASVTVNASFTAYSGVADYYYSGYNTSGSVLSNYDTKQLNESMLGGEKFAYYHVEGRTDTKQLFTIFTKPDEQGYVYFTQPKNFGYWSKSQAPKAYFWNDDGTAVGTAWPGSSMAFYDNSNSENRYRIRIPNGATHVKFSDGSSSSTNQTTADITLETGKGGYYAASWNDGNGNYNVGYYTVNNSDPEGLVNGTVYYNYKDDTVFKTNILGYTETWENWNVNDHSYARPNKDMSNKDYYIIVLYPGTTYTKDGSSYTVGNTYPTILWSEDNPVEDDAIKVFAKDGSIRSETYGSTYANIADTQIVASASSTTSIGTDKSGNISGQSYEVYDANPGETIYIRTTINNTAGLGADTPTNRNKYYVRGFCINGEVSELKTWDSSGVYTTSYKIPEDYDGKVEITPIYYLKDTTDHPIVTFRVTNFPKGKFNWGDTIYAYPFYGKLGGQNNAFGAYPGQPLVFYKGQYQIQIPQKSTAWDPYYSDSNLSGSTNAQKATNLADTAVSGVTMSNGYYDSVHRSVMGYGGNGASADHVQTYDYGDFYKIFNEKKPVDNIVFDFKYKTTKHNLEDIITTSTTANTLNTKYGTGGNGFELLTNFHGRHVDLFGTPLSGDAADPSKTKPLYVVSVGGVTGSAGVENIAGYYATEWNVYAPATKTGTPDSSDSYSRITNGKSSIPPEVLVLNDDDTTSFNTTTYPSAVNTKSITDWKALYTSLEAYRGMPVYISYEAADAQIGSGNYATSGGGGATRNDGRWLYSKNGETITSKIRVDVSNDSGATYTPNSELGTPVDDLEAYFTNDGVEGQQTYTTTIDPDKTFDFEANSNNADYKFMGWYMEDGTKITTDNISHTERSGSYTFVARFMYFTGGQLILSHKNVTGTAGDLVTYNGSGNTTIAVTVKNGDEVVREISATSSDITLDDKIINNANSAYTIEVTLGASGVGEDAYARTECDKANSFFGNQSAYTSMPQTFSFTVGSLFASNTQTTKKITYNSYFNQVAYSYDVTFKFNGRLVDSSGNRVSNTFRKQGTLTAKQIANYVTGTGNVKYISPNFLTSIAPYEENYGENLVWDFSKVDDSRRQFAYTSATNSYKLTVGVSGAYQATQSGSSKELTVTFDLPFAYDSNGRANNIESMTKDTSQDNFVVTVNYGQIAKKNPTLGHSSPGATSNDNTYVTAPKVLVENGDNTYFQYWDVRDRNNKPVTKCYMTRFNFVAYDNYTVTPVYGSAAYEADDDDSISTSISFLDTTRNQWNNNGNGGASGIINEDALKASDLLFNDFLVSFSYKGKELNSSNLAGVNTGFVVQRLGTLEKYGGDDSRNTDTEYYKEKYKDQDDTASIELCINGSTVNGFDNITVAANQLDNKDRVQWYYSVYNSRGWNDETDKPKNKYTYLRYVYRAYSYIKDSNGITLSEPVYFTMYDKAVQ